MLSSQLSCSIRRGKNYEGIKCELLLVRQTVLQRKHVSIVKNTVIDHAVQLHELLPILDPLQYKVYTLPFQKVITGFL